MSGRPIPHTSPPAPVSTYLWAEDPSDACDMRHSAQNPHSACFRGSVHHPDRGMPAAASGPPAAPSPPSAFGQWNVVSLLPLSWAPVSARGQAWISRWRRGAPPVVPPRPPQGGGPSPERHNQLAGLQVTAEAGLSPAEWRPAWPTPDARGMRDARCLTPLRAGRLVTQLPCGHSWPMRRGRGSAHSGVTEGVSQGQASLTLALPRKFPSQTSHSLGRLCHFYFFFLFS